MSYNPRIEELSDSDPDAVTSAASDSDPDEMDIAELNIPQTATILPRAASPSAVTVPQPQAASPARAATEAAARERTKHHQCLYPVYFDAGRSRAEGRRVSRGLAVPNPLARDLADACASLSLNVVFEPAKCHPKDWANPGRVRVLVKSQGASVVADRGVNNSAFPARLAARVTRLTGALHRTSPLPQSRRLPASAPHQCALAAQAAYSWPARTGRRCRTTASSNPARLEDGHGAAVALSRCFGRRRVGQHVWRDAEGNGWRGRAWWCGW